MIHIAKKLSILCATLIIIFTTNIQAMTKQEFAENLVNAAIERTTHQVTYDSRYMKISYPGGDIPDDMGVCADVIVRSYRSLGIDLQKRVHEDMVAHFDLYPKIWGLKQPDTNIDHRRVPNLQVYLTRFGQKLAISHDPKKYAPGDIVTWNLAYRVGQPNNHKMFPHIGIVTNLKSKDGKRPMIVHNTGLGPEIEDMLFDYPITGHYTYTEL